MSAAVKQFWWALREGWGWRTAWENFRFTLGYRIGGFTSASRTKHPPSKKP